MSSNQSSPRQVINPTEEEAITTDKPSSSGTDRRQVAEEKADKPDSKTPSADGPPKRRITAHHLIQLMIPLTITMFAVILYVKFICIDKCHGPGGNSKWAVFEEKTSDSRVQRSLVSLGNAIVFITLIVISTFALLLVFYFRLDKIFWGLFFFTFLSAFSLIAGLMLNKIVDKSNLPFDYITACLLLWNYGAVAIITTFWKGPKILQQFYIVNIAILVSTTFMTLLPEWTSWTLLMALVVWDLIAVLCPFGPLRLLIKETQKRKKENKEFELPPGLLYSTMIWMSTNERTDQTTPEIKDKGESDEKSKKEKTRGPQLGLGDFVFYSILMGKAATYGDYNILLGCYIGIMFGFLLTLLLLAILQFPLPALPISISLAIFIFFCLILFGKDFINELNYRLIYI